MRFLNPSSTQFSAGFGKPHGWPRSTKKSTNRHQLNRSPSLWGGSTHLESQNLPTPRPRPMVGGAQIAWRVHRGNQGGHFLSNNQCLLLGGWATQHSVGHSEAVEVSGEWRGWLKMTKLQKSLVLVGGWVSTGLEKYAQVKLDRFPKHVLVRNSNESMSFHHLV